MIWWQLIIVQVVSCLFILLAVALGGYMVFRTKRGQDDSFFGGGQAQATAFNLDSDETFEDDDGLPETPEVMRAQNSRFVQQFAEKMPSSGGAFNSGGDGQ